MNGRNRTLLAVAGAVVVVLVVVVVVLVATGYGSTPAGSVTVDGCTIGRNSVCEKKSLNNSDFTKMNLSNSKFRCSNFTQTKLGSTSLTNVDFSYANMTGANMWGASGSPNFTGATFSNTVMPDGSVKTQAGQACPF